MVKKRTAVGLLNTRNRLTPQESPPRPTTDFTCVGDARLVVGRKWWISYYGVPPGSLGGRVGESSGSLAASDASGEVRMASPIRELSSEGGVEYGEAAAR